MNNLYHHCLAAISDGNCFSINFKKRSLSISGRQLIKDGAIVDNSFADFGIPVPDGIHEAIDRIQDLYAIYRHSCPSARSESRRRLYFLALPLDELSEDDIRWSVSRESARFDLEYHFLVYVCLGIIRWQSPLSDKGSWFWQPCPNHPLVIQRDWIEQP